MYNFFEMAESNIVPVSCREASLRRKVRHHLRTLGFTKSNEGMLEISCYTKEVIRSLHRLQRAERLVQSYQFLSRRAVALLPHFASGHEIEPALISPVIERVFPGTMQAELFRLASLTWSVPVSKGFGRRLRFLVWDAHNDKLIGIFAIGDPVFNLSARDQLIGWNVNERSTRLVNIMDAYVLGALPPYNELLAGKMVACLIRNHDVYDEFNRVYGNTVGFISKKRKKARLLVVTTTSSMGRSSVYNRLKLDSVQYFKSIGYTQGWGHFHIPDSLFLELREYLRSVGNCYADMYKFGEGPNWRLRTTRAALQALGFNNDILRHGIQREVFICNLVSNANVILRTGKGEPELSGLLNTREIAELALERWILPRSRRSSSYRRWKKDNILDLLGIHQREEEKNRMYF